VQSVRGEVHRLGREACARRRHAGAGREPAAVLAQLPAAADAAAATPRTATAERRPHLV